MRNCLQLMQFDFFNSHNKVQRLCQIKAGIPLLAKCNSNFFSCSPLSLQCQILNKSWRYNVYKSCPLTVNLHWQGTALLRYIEGGGGGGVSI